MDLYHCPRRGVFPIDGDCERFLMCREDSRNDGRIKGKVYRCPKGINNNWNSNSLQHFIMIRLLVLLQRSTMSTRGQRGLPQISAISISDATSYLPRRLAFAAIIIIFIFIINILNVFKYNLCNLSMDPFYCLQSAQTVHADRTFLLSSPHLLESIFRHALVGNNILRFW